MWRAIDHIPELFSFRRIRAKSYGAAAVRNNQVHSWYYVVNRDRNNIQMGHLKLATSGYRNVLHHWTIIIPQTRKAGIDIPIKNIALEKFRNFRGGVHAHRF